MNTNTTTRFARYIALPAISAGVIAGAALGLAGTASAATTHPEPRPGIVATPDTKAHPAPTATPGRHAHQGAHHIADLNEQMHG